MDPAEDSCSARLLSGSRFEDQPNCVRRLLPHWEVAASLKPAELKAESGQRRFGQALAVPVGASAEASLTQKASPSQIVAPNLAKSLLDPVRRLLPSGHDGPSQAQGDLPWSYQPCRDLQNSRALATLLQTSGEPVECAAIIFSWTVAVAGQVEQDYLTLLRQLQNDRAPSISSAAQAVHEKKRLPAPRSDHIEWSFATNVQKSWAGPVGNIKHSILTRSKLVRETATKKLRHSLRMTDLAEPPITPCSRTGSREDDNVFS